MFANSVLICRCCNHPQQLLSFLKCSHELPLQLVILVLFGLDVFQSSAQHQLGYQTVVACVLLNLRIVYPENGCWKHLGTDTNQSEWMGDNEPGNSNLLSLESGGKFRRNNPNYIRLYIVDPHHHSMATIASFVRDQLSKALLSQCREVSCSELHPIYPTRNPPQQHF